MSITCSKVLPEHSEGLTRLFNAANVPCFCRFWSFEGDDNDWQLRCATDPAANRSELEAEVISARAMGVVALKGEQLVGWLKLAPASAVPKMFARRLYRAEPWFRDAREGVFVVGCLLVHPRHRKEGVARALVEGASAVARGYGARSLEVLPRRLEPPIRDETLWNGPLSTFEAAGFARVAGIDAYPVLRVEL